MAEGTAILVYFLVYIGEFCRSSDISINLVVGVITTVCVLLVMAVIVSCVVTWKMKTEDLMSKLRKRPLSSVPTNSKNTNVRSNIELKNRGLSKSTTCLNNSTAINTGPESMTKSISCSVLNMPLPSEPNKKEGSKLATTIYDDDLQMTIMLEENDSYASTNPNVSVAAMADKFNKGATQEDAGKKPVLAKDKEATAALEKEDHLYEQM